jgi:hypothetical protein
MTPVISIMQQNMHQDRKESAAAEIIKLSICRTKKKNSKLYT